MKGDLVIPDKVEEIGSCAFQYCGYKNGYLYIGKKVKTIGAYAFYTIGVAGEGFSVVESFATVPPTPPSSSPQNIIQSHQKNELRVPSGSLSAYKSNAAWSGFTTYTAF